MAETQKAPPMDRPPAHDGRFGLSFDAEVGVMGIIWTTVGLAATCALGMWITWAMLGYYADRAPAVDPSPFTDVGGLPDGPVLQRDPEGELEALREEMAERLSSYGWTDEGAGVVHIPIDEAIDLLVERGSVAATGAGAAPVMAGEEEAAE